MYRFISGIQRKIIADRTFKEVIELSKQGKQVDALKICTVLVNQYPYDVQYRHKLALLQTELGKEIVLPKIGVSK